MNTQFETGGDGSTANTRDESTPSEIQHAADLARLDVIETKNETFFDETAEGAQ